MTVALKQENVVTEIGPGGILHSLFSTVAVRLEGGRWGSRFPIVMSKLYEGSLPQSDALAALSEMRDIKAELSLLAPANVVWDAEDLKKGPPWGRQVGPHVQSCAQYWVTTTGRNVLDELIDNLESLLEFGGTLDVISYDGLPRH